ncbi:CHAT domain-containing protein [Cyanobium sp. Alchichica 3B3-8F6]|uniref:CHAT domain-containing tetratricopeptide repeat protein n=1 Tax=Cyanobium sp. Alchichica 3B3-8F6 TaxID=2823696 RepID=UPI0020CFE0DF|nr:CHAT domain-containing protein [Cyanobium sp. Alchichica 3B3-8F6]MCP9883435.1 CHAT domain-containing protein [Cyanobium sp. Alchichica 3B3-8F6]
MTLAVLVVRCPQPGLKRMADPAAQAQERDWIRNSLARIEKGLIESMIRLSLLSRKPKTNIGQLLGTNPITGELSKSVVAIHVHDNGHRESLIQSALREQESNVVSLAKTHTTIPPEATRLGELNSFRHKVYYSHPHKRVMDCGEQATGYSILSAILYSNTCIALALLIGVAHAQPFNNRRYNQERLTKRIVPLSLSIGDLGPDSTIQNKAFPRFQAELAEEWNFANKKGAGNPADIKIIVDRARLAEESGNIQESLSLWRLAAEQSNHLHRTNDQYRGYVLASLGRIEALSGLYEKALKTKLEALRIYEVNISPGSLDTAIEHDAIGSIYYALGRLGKAEEYMLKALSANGTSLNTKAKHQKLITLHNLSSVYTVQNRYKEAEEGYLSVIQELGSRQSYQVDSGLLANSYSNLANLYRRQGRTSDVEQLYIKAISTTQSSKNVEVLLSQDAFTEGLASFYAEQGNKEKAQELLLGQIEAAKASGRSETFQFATLLVTMASINIDRREYTKADEIYTHAIALLDKELPNHPDKGHLLLSMAYSQVQQGDFQKAATYAMNGFELLFRFAREEAPLLTKSQREDFIRGLDEQFHRVFQYAATHKEGSSVALFVRLNRQGLIQEIERKQHEYIMSQKNGLQRPRSKPRVAMSSLHELTHPNSFRETPQGAYPQSYLSSQDLRVDPISIKEVASLLPPDGVVIEIQQFRPFHTGSSKAQQWGEPEYVAFVLRPNASISVVSLGSARAIDKSVQEGLSASAEANSDADAIWGKLSDKILRPLLKELDGSRQWFISPDGELNRVPFTALPAPKNPSTNLSQAVKLRILSTSRELLRLNEVDSAGSESIVIANPDYDHQPARSVLHTESKESTLKPQRRPESFVGLRWRTLPGTELEGRQIAKLLNTQALTGIAASKSNLKRRQNPLVLHVATHGFFVANEEESPMEDTQKPQSPMKSLRNERPELGSGLVFAGANSLNLNADEDAYLTAAEAANLNLKGTQLVVLSACDTGNGIIRTGEGVYGLQRSLTVAGARSTLLSLWKVDDAATAEFMTRFYKRLKAGEGRSDAIAATQKEFRDGWVKDPKSGLVWNAPYYWAAWQLVGDWRPIPGL